MPLNCQYIMHWIREYNYEIDHKTVFSQDLENGKEETNSTQIRNPEGRKEILDKEIKGTIYFLNHLVAPDDGELLFYKFLWGSKDKVKRIRVVNGGLNMINTKLFFDSLHARWITRILETDPIMNNWV